MLADILMVLTRGKGGGGARGLSWVEAGDAAQYPTTQHSPHTKSYPVPGVNSDAIERACSRKMKEETVTVAVLFLANSLLYLARHKRHGRYRLQLFIIMPSVQGRTSVPRLHGLSKTK